MKKLLVSAAASALLATSAMAQGNTQTGCGLGTLVIKNPDSAVMYALQATTNGTSGNQTFGITSGTLNCEKTKFVMDERTEKFVAANMDQLSKDIAKGQGETVNTLAELMDVKDKGAFAANLQKNYNRIYTSQNVNMANVLDNISQI